MAGKARCYRQREKGSSIGEANIHLAMFVLK